MALTLKEVGNFIKEGLGMRPSAESATHTANVVIAAFNRGDDAAVILKEANSPGSDPQDKEYVLLKALTPSEKVPLSEEQRERLSLAQSIVVAAANAARPPWIDRTFGGIKADPTAFNALRERHNVVANQKVESFETARSVDAME